MRQFKAGQYLRRGSYRSFQPNPINRQWQLDDMEVIQLLDKANREVGRLDMYSEYIPNIELFIGMHVLKEATLSSRIEGTRTNMEEALLEADEVPAEKRHDWEEVRNYIRAMERAIELLNDLPFSSRLIKETHATLMRGVRGEHKQPGDFRRSQNWIGGSSISDAIFVPPVYQDIEPLMGDLENFAHSEEYYFPELLRIALIHYQFETIHPFLDGNGRVGRLMITLYLVSKKILKRPVLYLSAFLEQNRTLYYDNLMRVREKDDITHWFKFFLTGIIQTAREGVATFDQILKLQREVEAIVQGMGSKAASASRLMSYLYTHPLVDAEKVSEVTEQSLPTAYALIREMEASGILTEITGSKRGRKYLFKNYMDLFR